MIMSTGFIRILLLPSLLYAQAGGAPAQTHFCATYNDDATPEDCSFTTMQMCQQSVDGVGGYCAPQSEAPVALPPSPPLFDFRRDPYAFAPAPMPPPPDLGAPAAQPPMQLPDASPNNN